MLVMILQKTPRSLRGELSRWMIEPCPGVFLGNVTQRVRDELWQKVTAQARQGAVMQFWSDRHPQGYRCRTHGTPLRKMADFDGIMLAVKPVKSEQDKTGSMESEASEKKTP